MSYQNHKLSLSWTHDGRVGRLTMTSPQTLNAMDDAMAEAFREVFPHLVGDHVRAIVLSGEGRAFSAGGDLAMLRAKADNGIEVNRAQMMQFYLSFLRLRDLLVPLVCGLHGHAVGAGFCLAAACDLRVADVTAQFAAPFSRLGLHPGMGGSYFLPRALGTEVARDLMLTGRPLGAQEGRALGFLSAVVPEGELDQALERALNGILLGGPRATRKLLHNQREAERADLEKALFVEADEQADCYTGPEFLEGLDAVSEKRPAHWT